MTAKYKAPLLDLTVVTGGYGPALHNIYNQEVCYISTRYQQTRQVQILQQALDTDL